MEKTKIHISCCLCLEIHTMEIEFLKGWNHINLYDETSLCTDHQDVNLFIESNCPGCVGGWGDCNLWKDFAYSKMLLTKTDMDIIKSGKCPKRTNGTFGVTKDGKILDLDYTDEPSVKGGVALVKAIENYCKMYHK